MKKYAVYKNNIFEGSTIAKSEAQAINNVRHNNYGETESQFSNVWAAVDVEAEESEKVREKFNEKMTEAVENCKKIWQRIPEGSAVFSLHPPCEFYPMFKNIEPDLISRGTVNGQNCDLGFFRGETEPTIYRIEEFKEDDPQKQIDIFSL